MKKYFLSVAILFSLLLGQQATVFAQKEFKILSYNVLKGLQQDSLIHKEYFEWVKAINPDIVAYQEMNGFTQKSLEQFAAQYSHPYAIQSKLEGFPVALSSKYPIVNVKKVVDNMWHAFIYAKINGIHIFVIHFSPFNLQKKQEEVRNVLAHAAEIPANEKILIMGDFNSVSKRDAAEYSEAMVKGMQEREKKEAHIRNLNNGQIDYSVIDAVEKAGFKDTFWLTNKKFVHSIPVVKYGKANPKRIDFMFANQAIAKEVKSSVIIHDEHTDNMSDHYPVLVTFGSQK
ncbi:endonuclease/exonuclease/phosphatase family protein [Pedobacter nyackensis]|uniref:endonuclease/exonuclease/phosphatase family protein n=1 Tax=Pedobacter nyackensis TaxID=475255 RepID=UPI00293136B4|nr:endonuclease/exonuclease/phosphatase family protein [Pedobacter nyackensis]